MKNPFEGHVYWEKSKDFLEFDVSLYRGINDDKFEQKEWELILENVITYFEIYHQSIEII